jgi:hypothetical protein
MKPLMPFVYALTLVFLSQVHLKAQLKYETRSGKVTFHSKTAVEEIYAENNQASSILKVDGSKKIVAFNVMMRSFKFEKALMEEHFNEKYVHSETYPSARFIGEIKSPLDLTEPGVYKSVHIQGSLAFHGVTNPITISADIEVKQHDQIAAFSTFKIVPDEYNVKIPKLVSEQIAKEIVVTVDVLYKQSNK